MPEKSEKDGNKRSAARAALGLAVKMFMRLPLAGLGADAAKAAMEMAAPRLERAELRALSAARLLIDLRLARLAQRRDENPEPPEKAGFTTIEIE